jgi:hypothetical protein
MTIDIRRRGFIFGAAATAGLVVAAPKKYFILSPPKPIIVPVVIHPGEFILPKDCLPLQQLLELQKKLDDAVIEASAIPRWLYMPEAQYDRIVNETWAAARERVKKERL